MCPTYPPAPGPRNLRGWPRIRTGGTCDDGGRRGALALEGWALVRQMLDDLTATIEADAETELELLEGLRVLGRVTALASELSLDMDPAAPRLFSMNTPARFVGGPNPDGEYLLGMIDGRRRYRLHGHRGTSAYLGFQVLAGVGLTPRRMAAHLSDRDLHGGRRRHRSPSWCRPTEPTAAELGDGQWLEVPEDASAIVIREYVADRDSEVPADLTLEALGPGGRRRHCPPTQSLGEQLTSLAWTIAKLATLHRSIKPELLDRPNELVIAEAAELGGAETTPDNLYMIGTFRLAPDEALVIELEPPSTRYWSVTVENIWHECLEPRRRRSSITNAAAQVATTAPCGSSSSATDPGVGRLARHRRPPPRLRDHPLARPTRPARR